MENCRLLMKYLMIDRSQWFYKTDKEKSEMTRIDQITKEDLLKLFDLCVDEDFEMDVFDAKNLKNAAHQIIYKNIYLKLDGVRKQRIRFLDEKTALYSKAIEEYTVELESMDTQ